MMRKKVGLISDTHGFLHPEVPDAFADCDEIWHAGDFGTSEVADQLAALKPFRGVYGNIDDGSIRQRFPEDDWFDCCGVSILMTHIAGHPKRYDRRIAPLIDQRAPRLLICGHSHILRLDYDKKRNNMLCLNPGAAGNHGDHQIRTMMTLEFCDADLVDVTVIELANRGVPYIDPQIGQALRSHMKRVPLGPWPLKQI